MKIIELSVWLAIFLGTAITDSVAAASDAKAPQLSIQMVPGILITGITGSVSIIYTDNQDQAIGWTLLADIQVTNNSFFYVDLSVTNTPKRVYRAVSPPSLVWIPPGNFMMGSPSKEVSRDTNEGPQTLVMLTRGFWMSKYETTQGEYMGMAGNNPSYFDPDRGYSENLRRPVEHVTWREATNFCSNLTLRERAAGRLPAGYAYRLPTEAEWEYACRAGTTTATAYGDSLSSTQANFNGAYPYNGGAMGPNRGTTTQVGSYAPNAWGLCDMHGNVWEWCLDSHVAYPGGSLDDPSGPISPWNCVDRGGCWYNSGELNRSAHRGDYDIPPGVRNPFIGFRPVLAPVQ